MTVTRILLLLVVKEIMAKLLLFSPTLYCEFCLCKNIQLRSGSLFQLFVKFCQINVIISNKFTKLVKFGELPRKWLKATNNILN